MKLFKLTVTAFFILLSGNQLFAQFFSPGFFPGGYYNRFGYNPNNRFWNNMPFVSYESAGNLFWDAEWNLGRAVLKNEQVIEGYPLRYDIGNNLLEVQVNNEIKMLPIKEIKYLEWIKDEGKEVSFFVNGFDYRLDGVGVVGLLKVLTTGEVQLLEKNDVDISRSNYVSGFSTARSVERASVRQEFFLLEGKNLLPITKKEKDNLIQFGELGNEIKKFAKEHKLKWKKAEDLVKIVDEYNRLLAKKE